MKFIELKTTRINADHLKEYGSSYSEYGEKPCIDFHLGHVLIELQFNTVEARNEAQEMVDIFLREKEPGLNMIDVGFDAVKEARISMKL